MERSFARARRRGIAVAIVAAIAVLIAIGFAESSFSSNASSVEQGMEIEVALGDVLVSLDDAETGQRGFLLTGDTSYLRPYDAAIDEVAGRIDRLRRVVLAEGGTTFLVDGLEPNVRAKIDELRTTIHLRQAGRIDEALAIVSTGRGDALMKSIRSTLRSMQNEENRLLLARRQRAAVRDRFLIVSIALMSVIFGIAVLFVRTSRERLALERRAADAQVARLVAEKAVLEQKAHAFDFQRQFLGIVGHDLRNPLSTIAATADLLLTRAEGDAKWSLALGRITASAERMRRMIDQLLDLTRTQLAGGLTLRCTTTDLRQVVSEIVEETRGAHPARSFDLTCDGSTVGRWDPDRLGQVVSNLLGNAVSYGIPSKPIQIRVTGDEHEVGLEIHNEGAPIPADLQAHIFEPFQRGKRLSHRNLTAGLGLGLFITREIVAAHGGRVSVASSETDGTAFRVRFPRAPRGLEAGPGADSRGAHRSAG